MFKSVWTDKRQLSHRWLFFFNGFFCRLLLKLILFLSEGENIEEVFTRIAVVAFENTVMKELEAISQPSPSNGQLSSTSPLICKE